MADHCRVRSLMVQQVDVAGLSRRRSGAQATHTTVCKFQFIWDPVQVWGMISLNLAFTIFYGSDLTVYFLRGDAGRATLRALISREVT